jgi:tripartite-type tricarboxylate transporter receptor subunit TctC
MRQKPHKKIIAVGVTAVSLSLFLTGCGGSAGAQPGTAAGSCEPLRGKAISLVVPFSPGGGYDTFARIIAPKLGEALKAQVVVKNEPGAGGLVALNKLVHAKKDGTQIAIINGTGTASSILAGAEGAKFGFHDFSYIGRIGEENAVVVSAAGSSYDNWEDVLASDGFRFGSTGPGASDYITSSVVIEAFDLKNAKVVTGFAGNSEVDLAMLQGNVDGLAGSADSRRAGIASGEQIGLLSIANERATEAPDAPTVGELDLTEKQKLIMDAQQNVNDLGRSLVAPAGIEAGLLECLRDALETVATDDGVLAQAEKQFRPISFVPGAEVEKDIVGKLKNLPDEYITVLKDSV